jgi:two-component system chemotaxis response regulator CheB
MTNTGPNSGIVIIGCSTGGPEALRKLLPDIQLSAAVIVVQHMPAFINESLRKTIEKISGMPCVIPKPFELIKQGVIYLAASDSHLKIFENRTMNLSKEPPVNFVCPSVDVTMLSLKKDTGTKIAGVILTGMGKDGAAGIKHMKEIGGLTMAQTPATCSVDGMPFQAIETGAVDQILNLDKIREKLIAEFKW